MNARGLPWYTVLLLSLAVWALVFAVVLTARHFRPPAPEQPPAEADEDGEPVLAGVAVSDLAAEFETPARPYANGVLAVGEDPGGHVSLKGDDHTDKEDL